MRDPFDGKPYYCETCGLGLGEWAACEEMDCKLESEEEAQERLKRAKSALKWVKDNHPQNNP